MIFAAGRGKRMMPLTQHTPKPLLCLAGKPLLQYHIENLAKSGIKEIVINHCYLGEQIENHFKSGSDFGVNIHWSAEPEMLETAGGIRYAEKYLGDQPFLLVNGDVWTDFDFAKLIQSPHLEALHNQQTLAHLIVVPNPPQHPSGDFLLTGDQIQNITSRQNSGQHVVLSPDTPAKLEKNQNPSWTYAGIALYHPQLVADCPIGVPLGLAPILRDCADKNQVSGEIFNGIWHDIGTPERLNQLEQEILTKTQR